MDHLFSVIICSQQEMGGNPEGRDFHFQALKILPAWDAVTYIRSRSESAWISDLAIMHLVAWGFLPRKHF